MSAQLYDDAVVKILQGLINDPDLKILKPEETTRLFEEKADESNDKLKLPIISLSRRGYRILNRNKQPKSFDGIKLRAYDNSGNLYVDEKDENKKEYRVLQLNAIPIQLEYQLDIYSLTLDECEDYAREFVFYFVNNPTGVVEIPYNNYKGVHKFTMFVEEEVEDNSDIKERLFPGQFTRYSLRIMIDDAYLWGVPSRKLAQIQSVELGVKDRQSHEEIEEIKIK